MSAVIVVHQGSKIPIRVGPGQGPIGEQGPAGDVARAATRAAMAAVGGAAAGMARQLVEAGREGMFVFDAANRAAEVAADTAQGIYVAGAADPSGAAGAWVRRFSGPANVKWFGALGNGVADDTAVFPLVFAVVDRAYAPKGTYVVTQVQIPAGKSLATDDFATVFRQKPGTLPSTPIVLISGSDVNLGSFKGVGNLNGGAGVDTTGEQNHVVLLLTDGVIGDLARIVVGDVHGENIRGDVFTVYSTGGATIEYRAGRLTGTNIYRCVAAPCTGSGEIISVDGQQVGFLVFDIEPDGSCAPVTHCRVGKVKGRFAGVLGTDPTRYVDGVEIGTLDLDPAHGGGVGSTPAYAPGAGLIDGLQVRNCKGLAISKFKANGFNGAAMRHIYNGGELPTQPIDIREMELTDCCKTEASLITYFAGAAGVTRLTVGHLKVTITRATISGIRACYAADIGPVDASLAADTRLTHACLDAEVGPITTSTTGTGYIGISSDGMKAKCATVNLHKVFGYCANARIEGGTVTTVGGVLVEGDGSDAHTYPVIIDSIINGSRYHIGIHQKVIFYRDGHTLASAYHHSSGDKVLGARGASVAAAVPAVAAPTKAEFDALVAVVNAIRDRGRVTTGHGLWQD